MHHERRVRRRFEAGALVATFSLAMLGLVGCGDEDDGGPVLDTTAPVITSGPTIADLTAGSARVEWTTDESSNSVVRYGLDTLLVLFQSDGELVTSHSIELTSGLSPGDTTYYRVESTDDDGNIGRSAIASFVPPNPTLGFEPDTTHASLSGDAAVTANLAVTGVTDLFFAGLTVLFDPAIVRCDSVTAGPFLSTGGEEIVAASHVDNDTGTAEVGVSRTAPSEGIDGGGILARFHFTPLATGTSGLTIETSDLLFTASNGDTMENFEDLGIDDGAIEVAP